MNKKNIITHFLLLLLICIWIVTTLNVILNYQSTSQIALSSSSLFAGYFGLFYWLIAGASAATSFTLGLGKLGILEDLRGKIFGESGGYEPEIYVALPEAQPIEYPAKSSCKEELLIEQNNSAVVVAKVNRLIKEEKRRSRDKMKSFYLFGETDFKRCQHKFGFLGRSHEDKPIPDECFGCPRIIECCKQDTKLRKKGKSELPTTL
jgi:hypothetical protein